MVLAIKAYLPILLVCILANKVVDSCNSNSPASACAGGNKGAACSESCSCSLNLTCSSGTCQCGINAQGMYGHSCNDACGCAPNSGLMCIENKCSCNKTTSLWDAGTCVTIETDLVQCDDLIYVYTRRRKRDAEASPDVEVNEKPELKELISGETSPFVSDASAAGWKCDSARRILYSPSFDPLAGKNKYYVGYDFVNSTESVRICNNLKMSRVMPAPGDEFEKLYALMFFPYIWVGASLDSRDNKYYYDNGKVFNQTLTNPDDNLPCVIVGYDDGVLYFSVGCIGLMAQTLCANY